MTTEIHSPEYGSKIEHEIVRVLLKHAKAAGYVPVKVWDGGEYVEATTEREVLDAVFAVCTSTVHFAPEANQSTWGNLGVFLVVGNEQDLISDWHDHRHEYSAFSEAVRRTCEDSQELQ